MPCTKCEDGKYKWGINGMCAYDTEQECIDANEGRAEYTTDIVELVIDEKSEDLSIDAISIVTAPAIEVDFVYFNKQRENLTLAKVDKDKKLLVSPALIPNKQIYRYDANKDKEYYVYFSQETVKQASQNFLKYFKNNNATIEHEQRVSGVSVVESWIVEDPKKDKSNLYGFNLPKGTWFVTMKIENPEVWQLIKDKKLKGLSIEGYFIDKMQTMSSDISNDILLALNDILQEENQTK